MDERQKAIWLELKKMGAKEASIHREASGELLVSHVEFFHSISPLDLDTLIPPADPEEDPSRAEPVPKAIARILQKGSVS